MGNENIQLHSALEKTTTIQINIEFNARDMANEWTNQSINVFALNTICLNCIQRHGGAIDRPTDRQTGPIGRS